MELDISENINRNEWDSGICALGGTIFHSSVWAEYTRASSPNVVPQFIRLRSRDEALLGAALGFKDLSVNRFLAPFTGHLWFDAIPLVDNGSQHNLEVFLRLLEEHARESGYAQITIGSFASRDGSRELFKIGFALTERFEFELDLNASEAELWKRLAHKRRKNINKALRSGVVIDEPVADIGIIELRNLQAESAVRILKRGGPNTLSRDWHSKDPINVLLESGFGRIRCARINGNVLSAGLFTIFNSRVYHLLSGHSPEALERQSPTLLLWESIRDFRNKGANKFNLSGCKASASSPFSPEHGVFTYKKAFGAATLQCFTGSKILSPMRYKILSLLRDFVGR